MSSASDAIRRAREIDEGRPPRFSRWSPQTPTPKQLLFMRSEEREGLFGGGAGGGKSSALLLDALQYVDCPTFSALIIRKTFADLTKADALIPRADLWLSGTGAKRQDQGKRWRFPSGATLEFGHLENKGDELQYQSAQFNYIGFDELTQHAEEQYTFLFSRLRKDRGTGVPSKVRATTNPGGPGHEWVYARFIADFEKQLKALDPQDREPKKFSREVEIDLGPPYGLQKFGRFFVPSLAIDNPYLDLEDYLVSLANMTPVQREQMLRGDWDIRTSGGHILEEWFQFVDRAPEVDYRVRAWDPGLTKTGDPTASSLMSPLGRTVYIEHQTEERLDTPGFVESVVKWAKEDGPQTVIAVEESAVSKALIYQLRTDPRLDGYKVVSVPVHKITGPKVANDKLARAVPWINALEAGRLKLVKGHWNQPFIGECLRFTNEKGERSPNRIDSVSVGFSQVFKSTGKEHKNDTDIEPGSKAWYVKKSEDRRRDRKAREEGWF